jgi:hypothetical protein
MLLLPITRPHKQHSRTLRNTKEGPRGTGKLLPRATVPEHPHPERRGHARRDQQGSRGLRRRIQYRAAPSDGGLEGVPRNDSPASPTTGCIQLPKGYWRRASFGGDPLEESRFVNPLPYLVRGIVAEVQAPPQPPESPAPRRVSEAGPPHRPLPLMHGHSIGRAGPQGCSPA